MVTAQKSHDGVEDEDQEADHDQQTLVEEVAGVVSIPGEIVTACISSWGAQTPDEREHPEEKVEIAGQF